jgi:hypothetical protein
MQENEMVEVEGGVLMHTEGRWVKRTNGTTKTQNRVIFLPALILHGAITIYSLSSV